ncbi:hypothetical protein BayCH28_10080 [Mycolicibacterium sp. CH28]|uniref:hypothetical protein n=1 Tax=Mycolicibacterium sp. CH28 TaxID=2512237 RepID=UPI0010821FF6|nr:hypothetical protein [Mycolicibacterium sp. CH28]TGD88113.1 hypothetical protein BayCH28_10080 [Mycolicibacterium sp. CH28]
MSVEGLIDNNVGARGCVRLRPHVFAPRIARKIVHELGDRVKASDRLVDDAALVVSELVTESIRKKARELEVDVELVPEQITVRVRNAHALAPLLGPDDEQTPSRSSAVVRHFSSSWGCRRYQHGWEVWAVMRPTTENSAQLRPRSSDS